MADFTELSNKITGVVRLIASGEPSGAKVLQMQLEAHGIDIGDLRVVVGDGDLVEKLKRENHSLLMTASSKWADFEALAKAKGYTNAEKMAWAINVTADYIKSCKRDDYVPRIALEKLAKAEDYSVAKAPPDLKKKKGLTVPAKEKGRWDEVWNDYLVQICETHEQGMLALGQAPSKPTKTQVSKLMTAAFPSVNPGHFNPDRMFHKINEVYTKGLIKPVDATARDAHFGAQQVEVG